MSRDLKNAANVKSRKPEFQIFRFEPLTPTYGRKILSTPLPSHYPIIQSSYDRLTLLVEYLPRIQYHLRIKELLHTLHEFDALLIDCNADIRLLHKTDAVFT